MVTGGFITVAFDFITAVKFCTKIKKYAYDRDSWTKTISPLCPQNPLLLPLKKKKMIVFRIHFARTTIMDKIYRHFFTGVENHSSATAAQSPRVVRVVLYCYQRLPWFIAGKMDDRNAAALGGDPPSPRYRHDRRSSHGAAPREKRNRRKKKRGLYAISYNIISRYYK